MEKHLIIVNNFETSYRNIFSDFFKPFNFDLLFLNKENLTEELIALKKPAIIISHCSNYLPNNINKIILYTNKFPNVKFLILCTKPELLKADIDNKNIFYSKIEEEPTPSMVYDILYDLFKNNFLCKFFNLDISFDTLLYQHKKSFKIFELSKKLNSEINLDLVLENIVNFTIDVLDAERASVFLIDKVTNEMWSRVGVGLDKQELRFPIDKGIAGETVLTGKTLFIDDPYHHPKFNKQIDIETGFITTSILCVPLKNSQGEIIGVFQVLNKIDGKFTQEDEDLLYAFSSNAAKAIENSLLYEERERQLIELERSYKELKEAQEVIIRQEKLATIGQIFSGVAHEVKNQLTIVSAVSAIKKLYPNDERIVSYTDLIIDARNRILNLLNEIRDFAKKTSYEKARVDLIKLINSTIEFCKYDKDLDSMKLEKDIGENSEVHILANEDKIKQVLINLIRNAAHASQPNSKIIVSIEELSKIAIIKVKDFGSGIPHDIRNKIWEPFFTTKKSGTGLGLDICRKIIDNHDGRIWFETEEKVGTTFLISLPKV